FETFAAKATRDADNSGSTASGDLSNYHLTFVVNGYKQIASDAPVWVFENQTVNYADPKWSYKPLRFWDKSASGYFFYAAAPKKDSWGFDKTTKKYTFSDLTLTGESIASSDAINSAAIFGDYDLMLAHDVEGYTAYNSDPVNLEFDHILSRFNIGVRMSDKVPSGDVVITLKEIGLFNMANKGSFDEGLSSGDALKAGTNARWTNDSKFTESIGYKEDLKLDNDYCFVYQALFIPQQIEDDALLELDGSNKASYKKAYLYINYTLTTKDENDKDVSEDFKYYYNLAHLFNGSTKSDKVAFNEGWQNVLYITIDPLAINFDGKVYEWDYAASGDATIPE
ncbi:MAG: fimbrillin family protein, partial [Bacteroidetes bacterium]|nr:fimbrillin family protein [Candidatus Colenecus caballi]